MVGRGDGVTTKDISPNWWPNTPFLPKMKLHFFWGEFHDMVQLWREMVFGEPWDTWVGPADQNGTKMVRFRTSAGFGGTLAHHGAKDKTPPPTNSNPPSRIQKKRPKGQTPRGRGQSSLRNLFAIPFEPVPGHLTGGDNKLHSVHGHDLLHHRGKVWVAPHVLTFPQSCQFWHLISVADFGYDPSYASS